MTRYKIDYMTGEQEIIEADAFWPAENNANASFVNDTGIEPSKENDWKDRMRPFLYVSGVRRVEIIG